MKKHLRSGAGFACRLLEGELKVDRILARINDFQRNLHRLARWHEEKRTVQSPQILGRGKTSLRDHGTTEIRQSDRDIRVGLFELGPIDEGRADKQGIIDLGMDPNIATDQFDLTDIPWSGVMAGQLAADALDYWLQGGKAIQELTTAEIGQLDKQGRTEEQDPQ